MDREGRGVRLSSIPFDELQAWINEKEGELLSEYRYEIGKHIERISQALERLSSAADRLLEEVLIDGELTVPGAAAKLSERLKGLVRSLQMPSEITHSSVQALLEGLEELLHGSTEAGRRYVPRLPKVHKKVIKELDYHIRIIGDAYQKIRKISEKNRLPKELDRITGEVEELEQKVHQLLKLQNQIEELCRKRDEAEERIKRHERSLEQFRAQSGLEEIEDIRREIDGLRMLVTNQLNFLKKPLKKLSQAAGHGVNINAQAAEGAEAYSVDSWTAFRNEEEGLGTLKALLTALGDAVRSGKLRFKPSINRKILEKMEQICHKGSLDELHRRYLRLRARLSELESGVSSEDKRQLEESLERAKWEHRDLSTEIAHCESQLLRLSGTLRTIKDSLEKHISRITRQDIQVDLPPEIQSIMEQVSAEG